MDSADSVRKDFLGTRPSTWQCPRRGGGHNRDLSAPYRGSLPGDESLLPLDLFTAPRSKLVSLCPGEGQERRVAEREREAEMQSVWYVYGGRAGELSDMVNLHLGLKTTCQHHFLTTVPPPDLCHLYMLM